MDAILEALLSKKLHKLILYVFTATLGFFGAIFIATGITWFSVDQAINLGADLQTAEKAYKEDAEKFKKSKIEADNAIDKAIDLAKKLETAQKKFTQTQDSINLLVQEVSNLQDKSAGKQKIQDLVTLLSNSNTQEILDGYRNTIKMFNKSFTFNMQDCEQTHYTDFGCTFKLDPFLPKDQFDIVGVSLNQVHGYQFQFSIVTIHSYDANKIRVYFSKPWGKDNFPSKESFKPTINVSFFLKPK